jgi:hypothetical protein
VFPGPDLIGDPVDGTEGEGGPELLGSRLRDYYVYSDSVEYEEWAALFEPIVYS